MSDNTDYLERHTAKDTQKNAPGLFGKIGASAKKWFSGNVEKVDDLGKDDPYAFDFGDALQSLLGTDRRAARMRAKSIGNGRLWKGTRLCPARCR